MDYKIKNQITCGHCGFTFNATSTVTIENGNLLKFHLVADTQPCECVNWGELARQQDWIWEKDKE